MKRISQINITEITSTYFLPKVGFTASLWKFSMNLEFTNSKKGKFYSILDPNSYHISIALSEIRHWIITDGEKLMKMPKQTL